MLRPNELVVDNFAGGGGASTGMELGLNRHVDIAINHDPDAIDMHKLNHPETKHYCESVWDVDPVEACNGKPVGLAWFSPDCKHFSKAKGNRPVDKNIRGLAWVAVRWAALVPVRVFMLENVEEFQDWGPLIEVEPGKFKPDPERKGETFKAFIQSLTTGLDEDHPAWEEIKASLGDDFPYEKLKRGLGYKLEHNTLRACNYGAATIRKRFFLVARNDSNPIEWPIPTHGPEGSGLIPYKTAADIIDWSIPVRSIFGRKKPLADKTLERIAKGLKKFVFDSESPYIVSPEFQTPFITEHANASNQRNMPIDEPLRTICAQVKGGHFALVTSHIIKMRGTNIGHGTDEPVHTISAGGFHIGEVRAFLLKYYGTSYGEDLTSPIGTITTKERFGLVTVLGERYQIIDIGMRMLEPHELFASHGFPDDYKIQYDSVGRKLPKSKQVARCGNSVPPLIAEALVTANFANQAIEQAA